MRARIHRGAREIGGSCVELEEGGLRLVLDAGLPLDTPPGEQPALPDVAGLAEPGDGSLLGLVITHGHLDHYGLVPLVHPGVPLYMGADAHALLDAALFFSPAGLRWPLTGALRNRTPLTLGPFRITPYLVDHSAFDAYALLVEAGGRRLLYSGDLRAHGRKASVWRALLEDPPRDVDTLLLEGTHVAPGDAPAPDDTGLDEAGVEAAMAATFRAAKGAVFVIASAQNIDRLVTVYRACRRSGRTLVIDLYTATLAVATGRSTIPQPGFPELRVYVPNRQRVLVKKSQEFDRVNAIRSHRIYPEEIASRGRELVLLVQGSTLRELGRAGCLEGAAAIWSLWPGYLERSPWITDLLAKHGVPLSVCHSSGHATVADLQALAGAVGAQRVVPIHTRAPERFPALFPHVALKEDGRWWEV